MTFFDGERDPEELALARRVTPRTNYGVQETLLTLAGVPREVDLSDQDYPRVLKPPTPSTVEDDEAEAQRLRDINTLAAPDDEEDIAPEDFDEEENYKRSNIS